MTGKTSYTNRVSHGDTSEWQDCIQAALLGMKEEAQQLVLGRLDRGAAQMRFPGFCEWHGRARSVVGHLSMARVCICEQMA